MDERDREGHKFPNQLITILFNQSFPEKPDRTMKAIMARKTKIYADWREAGWKKAKEKALNAEHKQKEPTVKPEKVIVSQTGRGRGTPSHDKSAIHGGMGYCVSEDRYIVEHWSPDVNKRKRIAKKLGRTVAGCQGRLSNIKKKHPKYFMLLAGGHPVQTVNVLPAGTRKDETLLQRLDYWIVNRKAIKQAKKQAKRDRKRAKQEAKLQKKLKKLRGDF